MPRVATVAVLAPLLTLLLVGCTPTVQSPPEPTATIGADGLTGPVQPVGTPEVIASGLQVPWSIVRLDSGSTLISERDRGVVVELTADGELRDVGSVEGSKG